MKTLATTFFLIIATLFSLSAQGGSYEKAMKKALAEMEAAETPEAMLAAANTFERIGQKATDEYLPNYYAALNLLNYNWTLQDAAKRDEIIDRAMEQVKMAQQLAPGSDEVEVLNGYALMAKMTVDPMNRGQSYSPRIMQSFGKAMAMNPANPRAKIMMARMEIGTAQFMGTEPTKACELAREGAELLKNDKPVDELQPTWGMESANEILESCAE
ncbi:MAG: hypothetical protein ACI9CP_001874 [Cryomorphaceae bacterium]|jgi:hypothetical protein